MSDSSKKSRIQELYEKHLSPKLKLALGIGLSFLSNDVEAITSDMINNDKKIDPIEDVNAIFSVSYEDVSLDEPVNISEADLAGYISTHSLGDLRECGLLPYDIFKDYQFTKKDFQEMRYGKTSENVYNRLKRSYGDKNPGGYCLRSVRQTVEDETGVNILAVPTKMKNRKGKSVTSYPACNWGQGIENAGDESPIIYLGQACADNQGGNVSLMDLVYLKGITIMSGGEGQPCGHVCLNKPIYDNSGALIKTEARCDGVELLERILDAKMNARYGNTVDFYCFQDDTPSEQMSKYLAKELTQRALEENKLISFENDQLKVTDSNSKSEYFAQRESSQSDISFAQAVILSQRNSNMQ